MKQILRDFRIVPRVVPADRESTVTMYPQGENAMFVSGKSYRVVIREVECACSHYNAFPGAVYDCVAAEDGSLSFTHLFRGEQKHTVTVTRPEDEKNSIHFDITHRVRAATNVSYTFGIYSLKEDLYGRRALKCELHCHTWESDGRQDVAHTVGNYRTLGYDLLAITDHYIAMSSEKAMKLFDNAPVSMMLLRGEEVHLPTERIHAVHIGGVESVNADFRARREEIREEVKEIEATLNVPENVNREDYAWRIWIARRTREFGGLSLIAHPHWVWNDTYFMADAITEQLIRDGVYDALELLNSSAEVDSTVAMWQELLAQGCKIPVVGVSDSHNTDTVDGSIPDHCYTFVMAKDRSFDSLAEAIRSEYSVAVDNSSGRPRIYGSYRMVKLIQFVLEAYSPMYEELCRMQGQLLSEWGIGGGENEENVALLAALNRRSDVFAEDFFGIR